MNIFLSSRRCGRWPATAASAFFLLIGVASVSACSEGAQTSIAPGAGIQQRVGMADVENKKVSPDMLRRVAPPPRPDNGLVIEHPGLKRETGEGAGLKAARHHRSPHANARARVAPRVADDEQ